MLNWLKKLDAFLLPKTERYRYSPYVWLVYLFFFFMSFFNAPHSLWGYIMMPIGIALFLVLYFNVYWTDKSKVKYNIIGIVAVGSLMTILSQGASVIFVYAGAFCCMLGSARKAVMGLVSIVLWVLALSGIFQLSPYFFLPAILFSVFIGGINIYQHEIDLKQKQIRLSQQEVKHLAQTAERERIARDLHDLIGHTFSVITLKADLAGKLIDKAPDKARQEIKELENLSRDALSQVREVVTGFRSATLSSELASAKYLLQSNEIDFDYTLGDLTINDTVDKELAIIFKELTTNIIKHAEASRVKAVIDQTESGLTMTVSDNGRGIKDNGENTKSGFGLTGIQERLSRWQGTLKINNRKGCEVEVFIADQQLNLEEAQA